MGRRYFRDLSAPKSRKPFIARLLDIEISVQTADDAGRHRIVEPERTAKHDDFVADVDFFALTSMASGSRPDSPSARIKADVLLRVDPDQLSRVRTAIRCFDLDPFRIPRRRGHSSRCHLCRYEMNPEPVPLPSVGHHFDQQQLSSDRLG